MTSRPALLAALAALACAAALAGCLGDDGEPAERPADPGRRAEPVREPARPKARPPPPAGRSRRGSARRSPTPARGSARYRIRLVAHVLVEAGLGQLGPGPGERERGPRRARPARDRLPGRAQPGRVGRVGAGDQRRRPAAGLARRTGSPASPRSRRARRRARSATTPPGGARSCGSCPTTSTQARLIVERMEALGVERPALIVGSGVYARELASELVAEARAAGIAPVETQGPARRPRDARSTSPRELAEAARRQPDAVVLALARDRYTAELLAGLGARAAAGQPADRRAACWSASRWWPPRRARRRRSRRSRRSRRAAPRPAGRASLARIAREQGAAAGAAGGAVGLRVGARRARRDPRRAARRASRRPRRRRSARRSRRASGARRSGPTRCSRNGAVEGVPLGLYRLEGDRFEYVRTLL